MHARLHRLFHPDSKTSDAPSQAIPLSAARHQTCALDPPLLFAPLVIGCQKRVAEREIYIVGRARLRYRLGGHCVLRVTDILTCYSATANTTISKDARPRATKDLNYFEMGPTMADSAGNKT